MLPVIQSQVAPIGGALPNTASSIATAHQLLAGHQTSMSTYYWPLARVCSSLAGWTGGSQAVCSPARPSDPLSITKRGSRKGLSPLSVSPVPAHATSLPPHIFRNTLVSEEPSVWNLALPPSVTRQTISKPVIATSCS
ncbi:hypothetical protein CDD83_9524 [Cordyceps sp. RAO-2017]|nr:hypothetical protein CDD83_9524 [Cordyceps sp. RAO-2017]